MTEKPLTDERVLAMKSSILEMVSGLIGDGFSALQIGAMMSGLSARILHAAGNPGAVDAVIDQLRKNAANAGHVGMQ